MELVFALLLVLANGFFVAVEFSVARLRPTQVTELIEKRRPGAKSALHAVEHIDSYLSACQLGITISSLGLGALGEPAFHDLLEPVLGDSAEVAGFGIATLLAFAIITTLHVVVGELAPKSAAISRTVPVVLVLVPIMRAFYMATKPLVDFFNLLGNLLLKPFGIPPPREVGHPHSEAELRELLRESSDQGLIEREEGELSEAALVFGDLRAREVMKPRAEVDYVLETDDVRTIAQRAIETGRTRLPICADDGGFESATGVINAKDLLPLIIEGDDAAPVTERVRPVGHVSESARVDDVLREMRAERQHLALVHDEHGTVLGLLTMEDIIEEIVGEIEDEFDSEREDLWHREDGRIVIDGAAPVRPLAQRLGVELGGHHESTLGGYLSEQLGRVPEVGETVEALDQELEILGVRETRVTEVAMAGDALGDGGSGARETSTEPSGGKGGPAAGEGSESGSDPR
jgi:CBS domain containing-hemolysin-like protein